MGKFTELIKTMLKDNNIDDERTLKALEDEGREEADEIAERLGQKEDKTAFVPKVDVPPVDIEKFEKNENDEKKIKGKEEKQDEGR